MGFVCLVLRLSLKQAKTSQVCALLEAPPPQKKTRASKGLTLGQTQTSNPKAWT